MNDIITQLDTWLKEHRPAYYAQLNPGLSASELTEWQNRFGFEFPEEFKQLYQWKNGQSAENREYFFDFCFFESMDLVYDEWDMACEDLLEFNEEGSMAWGESWLKTMSLLNGDGYCLDATGDLGDPGSIVYFIHNDVNKIVFDSLIDMMNMILTLFEQEVYDYREQNGSPSLVIKDEEKRDEIFKDFMR